MAEQPSETLKMHEMHTPPPIGPPGTITLTEWEVATQRRRIVLHPEPTNDVNDPLNWSPRRKYVTFGIASFYVLMTFVMLDIFGISFQPYAEMGLVYNDLNNAWAGGYVGLAMGCYLFIPFVYRFGRRPLYIFSTAVQLASAIWAAHATTAVSIILFNMVAGLGGAISETIIQITISDLFFVHQHGTASGVFLFAMAAGSFLGPVAAGYVIDSQGWQWMWWWTAIFFGVNLVAMVFFLEETKYTPVLGGQNQLVGAGLPTSSSERKEKKAVVAPSETEVANVPNSYFKRIAPWTITDTPILRHYYQPLVLLFRVPAVAYAAFTYGTTLAWISIMGSITSLYLLYPPYNFSPSSVGLFGLSAFVGVMIGAFLAGPMNDAFALWMSKRRGGIYEPEYRLWLNIPPIILCPLGLLLYGGGFANAWPWPVIAVAMGIYGFGFMLTADVLLTYVTDSYGDIVGDAFVAIAFVRNILSVIVLFALTPWLEGMGMWHLHVIIACLCLGSLFVAVPMLIWGKKFRSMTAPLYREYALRQSSHRDILN